MLLFKKKKFSSPATLPIKQTTLAGLVYVLKVAMKTESALSQTGSSDYDVTGYLFFFLPISSFSTLIYIICPRIRAKSHIDKSMAVKDFGII